MKTIYFEGNDTNYVLYIKGLKDKAELVNIEGKFRWIVTDTDGTQFISRPKQK